MTKTTVAERRLPANDDTAVAPAAKSATPAAPLRNEPNGQPGETPWLVEGVPVLDIWGRPRMRPAAVP